MQKVDTKKIDDLGRIVIPRNVRKMLSIEDDEPMDILVEDGMVILRKSESSQQCERYIPRTCGELYGSWGEIATAIKSGTEFKVGDYKKDRTVDGESFTMVVTDVTDEYVRFESRDCLGIGVQWNKEDTTDGGIECSYVQEWLLQELFSKLPDDLRWVIDSATRKYRDSEGNVKEYKTLLFLPAASEVFGEGECYGDKGLYEQMEYYKDRRNRMRGSAEGEDTCGWWLASVESGSLTYACYAEGHGHAISCYATAKSRVPVCFIIKK